YSERSNDADRRRGRRAFRIHNQDWPHWKLFGISTEPQRTPERAFLPVGWPRFPSMAIGVFIKMDEIEPCTNPNALSPLIRMTLNSRLSTENLQVEARLSGAICSRSGRFLIANYHASCMLGRY